MPIKQIKEYSKLRQIGDSTLENRMELLINHREKLISQIQNMNDGLIRLDDKIDFYKKLIES